MFEWLSRNKWINLSIVCIRITDKWWKIGSIKWIYEIKWRTKTEIELIGKNKLKL
jgi:hypothetical protein